MRVVECCRKQLLLRYILLFVGAITGITFAVGATWYIIHRQPLFLIVQSRFMTLNIRFLALNLCILILVVLAYKLSVRFAN